MPRTISVGPLALDGYLLVYILAIMAGYYMIMLRLRGRGGEDKVILEFILNGVLFVILFWKFSPLLINPSIIWNSPLQILMVSGTWKHVVIGIGIAFAYIIYKLRKTKVPLLLFIDTLPYGVTAAMVCKSLLIWQYGAQTTMPWGITMNDPNFQYHPLNIYTLIVSAILLSWLWLGNYKFGKGKILQDFLIYFGIGLMAVSLFENSIGRDGLFNSNWYIYLSMIVLGLTIPHIIRKVKYK